MPSKPKRPCSKVGCINISTDRYCVEHAQLAIQKRKQRHQHYDRFKRDQQAATFYHSVEWEAARLQALMRDHGLCQHCLLDKTINSADMVHHRIPIKKNWNFRLLSSNLVSLCNSCHAKIDHGKQ